MNKVGFIGAGSMGGMLIDGFLRQGVLKPEQVAVTMRSEESRSAARTRWSGVQVADTGKEVAEGADMLFFCMKPLDVLPALKELSPYISPETHIVSIAASVTLAQLSALHSGGVSRVIPSLTSELNAGVSLMVSNRVARCAQVEMLIHLLSAVSEVEVISERAFEMGANLTSSAPGMFAAVFESFVKAGAAKSGMSEKRVEKMVMSTLAGTVRLFTEKGLSFQEAMERVATKGGITEEAIRTVQGEMPEMYDRIFTRMLDKYAQLNDLIEAQSKELKG